MPFIKIDTSGMNNRYGRSTVKPTKSFQVTEFNSPAKNRAPYIPKTEAKEGDVLSFFDDGKGKVLTSFDGGYQSSQTSKVSDMVRVDLGLTPLEFKTFKGSKSTFSGVLEAPSIAMKPITITQESDYVPGHGASPPSKALYLDGSRGGNIGTIVHTEVQIVIDEIIISETSDFTSNIVVLVADDGQWILEFDVSGDARGANKLVMGSTHTYYTSLVDTADSDVRRLTLPEGCRAIFTRGANYSGNGDGGWKLQSLSMNEGLTVQTYDLMPAGTSGTTDLGSATKQFRNLYIDGTLEADAITVDGTALNEYIADTVGAMTTSNTESGITVTYQDADNTLDFDTGSVNATTVTITDNESTDEDNAIVFTAGGDVDGGNLGLESDGNLIYNPSTGTLTTTKIGAFTANGAINFNTQAMTGVNIDGGAIDGTTIGGNSPGTGAFTTITTSDGATFGSNAADSVTFNARVSSLIPSSHLRDLGDSSDTDYQWRHLYMLGNITMLNTPSVPTDGPTNGIVLFAEDVSTSSELKVVDEAANVTTLSPHNFSICGGPSEDMAWAYYSENKGKKINVDMLKLARLVEDLSGEKLVYTEEEKNAT